MSIEGRKLSWADPEPSNFNGGHSGGFLIIIQNQNIIKINIQLAFVHSNFEGEGPKIIVTFISAPAHTVVVKFKW